MLDTKCNIGNPDISRICCVSFGVIDFRDFVRPDAALLAGARRDFVRIDFDFFRPRPVQDGVLVIGSGESGADWWGMAGELVLHECFNAQK